MIGFVSEHEKVDKLWNGLSRPIQKELWKRELNPTSATWDEVREASAWIPTRGGHTRGRGRGRGAHVPNERGQYAQSRSLPAERQGSSVGGTWQVRASQPSSKLSKDEKDELTAAGKCFLCKKAGHYQRDCPTRDRVKSEKAGKPPGVSSYHMGVSSTQSRGRTDSLRALAATTETTAGIDLCVMGMPLEGNSDDEPLSGSDMPHSLAPSRVELPITVREGREPTQLGDLYAMRAEEVLNRCGPYCCEAAGFDGGNEYDANVYRTTDSLHVVMHYRGREFLCTGASACWKRQFHGLSRQLRIYCASPAYSAGRHWCGYTTCI
ncbi:hypothetical protein BC628DRAFT_1391582 [Trametes gibbosa]|nr:hypothetical protein BC628DRAFT_1391582 [Trametes gibbosa]